MFRRLVEIITEWQSSKCEMLDSCSECCEVSDNTFCINDKICFLFFLSKRIKEYLYNRYWTIQADKMADYYKSLEENPNG